MYTSVYLFSRFPLLHLLRIQLTRCREQCGCAAWGMWWQLAQGWVAQDSARRDSPHASLPGLCGDAVSAWGPDISERSKKRIEKNCCLIPFIWGKEGRFWGAEKNFRWRGLGYPQRFLLNFSPYITFLRHIVKISSPTFSSPAAVPPIFSPILHYNHKISFHIPTFHQLSIFLLLIIGDGPTATVEGEEPDARYSRREREKGTAAWGAP